MVAFKSKVNRLTMHQADPPRFGEFSQRIFKGDVLWIFDSFILKCRRAAYALVRPVTFRRGWYAT